MTAVAIPVRGRSSACRTNPPTGSSGAKDVAAIADEATDGGRRAMARPNEHTALAGDRGGDSARGATARPALRRA